MAQFKDISEFARLPLCVLPTPLYRLPNLSAALGKNLYIKRDDMTGVALGGNKVRKLEFLLAHAKAQGADYVLTTGGAQSNHAMLTAACAERVGMKAILVLKKRGVWEKKGNQVLNDIFGADVRFIDTDSYADVYAEMANICESLAASGHKGYCIPVGGSVALGSLGYLACVKEIAAQAEAMNVRFEHMLCATGSGGTHAGLALGAQLYMPHTRVTGVMVDDDPFDVIVPALMRDTAALLDYQEPLEDAHLYNMVGAGYAIPSQEGNAAMERMARREGILLDPVYTGKAFAGLLEMCEKGLLAGDNILFVHTGGAGGIFALR